MSFKSCSKCGIEKPIESDFRLCRLYKGSHDGEYRRSECKKCELRASRQLAKAKATAPLKPEKCECCGKPTKLKAFVVDHDHKTGSFRGWICRNCNQGIGKLGDDKKSLLKALLYLMTRK